MGNPNDQVQCALVAEQYEDETTKTTSQVLLQTSKVAPEPELEPATEEEDQERVADAVSEALKEGEKEDEPAGEVLVSESTPDENEKGVPPTVDEILEKMNGMDFEKEKEVAKQDAAAEKELAKDEVLDEKSSEEVVKAKAAVEEDEAEKKSEK